MSATNPYTRLLSLLPTSPLQVGEVTQSAAGVCSVELPGGGVIRARGDASVGQLVFVRNGVIEGTAPALTLVTIDV